MKNNHSPLIHPRQIFLEWYRVTSLGRILQTIEASYLQSAVKLTFNDTILQVGELGTESLYIPNGFSHRFSLVHLGTIPESNTGEPRGDVLAAAGELPIATASVDTLILPHVLEFEEQDRQRVLQEIERVLRPEGKLFVLGLNPMSPHGVIQYLPRRDSFWRTDFISSRSLLDRLRELKFEAESQAAFDPGSARILRNPSGFMAKSRANLSFAYAVKAIKRRHNLIPVAPSWIAAPELVAGHMFETQ